MLVDLTGCTRTVCCVRSGTALVGSHEEVANLIFEYYSNGFDDFILSGYPHLEEAYYFAEGVLPLLRAKGVA